MSSQRNDVANHYPELLALAPGVTAILAPIAGQLGAIIKYVSGGSLSILRNPEQGITTVGSSFAISNLYTLGTNEVMNLNTNQSLYMIATGATCVVNVLRLRSIGC